LNKHRVRQSFFCVLLGFAGALGFAEDWYVSNPGGMALEPAFSRFAIRGRHALSVGTAEEADIPDRLRKYYEPSFHIELRCLYEDGVLTRRQWTFRDDRETARMAAVIEDDNSGFIELYNADKLIAESHQLGAEGSDYITYYYYNRSFLVRAETWLFTPRPEEEDLPPADQEGPVAAAPSGEPASEASPEKPVAEAPSAEPASEALPEPPAAGLPSPSVAEAPSDPSVAKVPPPPITEVSPEKPVAAALPPPARNPSAVEGIEPVPVPRALGVPVKGPIVTEEGTEEPLWTDLYRYTRASALRSVERHFIRAPAEGRETELLRFPQLVIGVAEEDEFIQPASVLSSGFFSDVIVNSGDRILYNTDPRGRVLSEVRRDENDNIIGEIINTWSGDRLVSVAWKSEEEERVIEYEYDAAGDRIVERNLRNGALERTVRREGDREIEELYLNGEVALRAVWAEGRKISEEPVRSGANRGRSE
jgi:hypothetical protein